jgi:hypothetical protein
MKKLICILLMILLCTASFGATNRDFIDTLYDIMMHPWTRAVGVTILCVYAWNLITLKPPTVTVNITWWDFDTLIVGPVVIVNTAYVKER